MCIINRSRCIVYIKHFIQKLGSSLCCGFVIPFIPFFSSLGLGNILASLLTPRMNYLIAAGREYVLVVIFGAVVDMGG